MESIPKVKIITLILLTVYGLGLVLPDTFWATHYLAFLPRPVGYIIFLLAVLIVIVPKKYILFNYRSNITWNNNYIYLIAVVFGIICYLFPIAYDIYGDAYRHAPDGQVILKSLPDNFYQELFSLSPKPSNGRKSVLLFFGLLSHLLNLKYVVIFKWVGIVTGMLYIVTWLRFVISYFKKKKHQLLLGVIGITTPMMQFFFCHFETYALVNLLLLWWLILWLKCIEHNSKKMLWVLLAFTIFLSLKIHPTNILLGAVWFISAISIYKERTVFNDWKGILKYIFVPIFIIGSVIYFFVLEDYKDERFLMGVKDVDRLFLPILSPDPPLDRYNLLSWNHIFDYLLLMFQWASPALLILLVLFFGYRKLINWNSRPVLFLGTLLILYIVFFFVVNPLLSIPFDWDLFSVPTTIFVLFTCLLLKEAGEEQIQVSLGRPAIGLLLCALPIFVVNANKKMISYRLESANIHVFKTYYSHASDRLLMALSLLNEDRDNYIKRKERILRILKPYAVSNNDPGYGNLLYDSALFYFDNEDFLLARKYAQRAHDYDSLAHRNTMLLLQANFNLNLKEEAFLLSRKLANHQFPNDIMAKKVVIQMALETNRRDLALKWCRDFLGEYPKDQFIQQVYKAILNGEDSEQIAKLYKGNAH